MNDLLRKVLQGKRAARQECRELLFAEKIKMLQKLRDRSLAIAQSPLGREQRKKS